MTQVAGRARAHTACGWSRVLRLKLGERSLRLLDPAALVRHLGRGRGLLSFPRRLLDLSEESAELARVRLYALRRHDLLRPRHQQRCTAASGKPQLDAGRGLNQHNAHGAPQRNNCFGGPQSPHGGLKTGLDTATERGAMKYQMRDRLAS